MGMCYLVIIGRIFDTFAMTFAVIEMEAFAYCNVIHCCDLFMNCIMHRHVVILVMFVLTMRDACLYSQHTCGCQWRVHLRSVFLRLCDTFHLQLLACFLVNFVLLR
jgi:hypothetical protein